MELGDFGGGVGVLLRDGDSLGAEISEKRSGVNGCLLRDRCCDGENSIDSLLAFT